MTSSDSAVAELLMGDVMKRSTLPWLLCMLLFSLSQLVTAQNAKTLPSRPDVLSLMHRVDAWQVTHPVMPPTDRNWERGTWYTGVMEAWKATHDEAFFNRGLDWGKQNEWQVGNEPRGANRLFCSETWIELYLAKKDPAMIEPTVQSLAASGQYSPVGEKRWYLDGGLPYVDSLYGASSLAMLTRATGKQEYLATMNSFFDDITGILWDKESGLYYRDPTFIGKRTALGKKVLWSRGNGWAFAGIARVLEYLPKNDPTRDKYLTIYRRMASELIKRQSPDGFWRANLDDPEDVPNPESSGTAFFCFGFAWGINHKILDRREFLPPTERAYAALASAISPEGKVQWGQKVDSRPNAAQRESTHEYVSGAFLLAASEVYNLSPKSNRK
jgi:unsaturated rhamnogalacturonyl hydrolase